VDVGRTADCVVRAGGEGTVWGGGVVTVAVDGGGTAWVGGGRTWLQLPAVGCYPGWTVGDGWPYQHHTPSMKK
jgi:hypothetical protein